MDLGTIAARMTLDISNFTSQLNLAQNQAQRLALESSRTFQFGDALTKVGGQLTKAVTLPILGIGTAAVKVGNEFQAQMSRVQAIAGASGKELDQLKQQAVQLGAKTAFSAKEAAQGMENMASAGFSVKEIMGAMPGVLDLAAVSGGDVAGSADAMATSLRAFGLEADQAGHVANVFAKAAADTNAETVDMAEAMKYVAPVAHAMGISLEETAAAIGIMADAGIKGSQAGTSLRGALSRLAHPTKAMQEAMQALGISFYDANGNMIPLKDQIGLLKQATAGLTQEERNRYLVTLYGKEALSGMLALMDAGPEKIDKMTNSFINSDGAAKKMAETMQDNLSSKIEQLGGALESAAIIIQQILEPALRKVVEWLTKLIEKFINMSPEGQKLVIMFAAIAAAVGPVLLIIGTLLTTFAKLKIAIQFLGPAFMGTAGTIGAVLGVVAALGIAFGVLYIKSEKFRNFVNKLAAVVGEYLGKAFKWAGEQLKEFGHWLEKVGSMVAQVAESMWNGLVKLFKDTAQSVGITNMSLKDFIHGSLAKLYDMLGGMGGIMSIATGWLTKLGLGFLGITGPIGIVISAIISFITAWVRTGELNSKGINMVFDGMVERINKFADGISTYLPKIVEFGAQLIVKLAEGIARAIPNIASSVGSGMSTFIESITKVLPTILNAGVEIVKALVQGIGKVLPALIQAGIQIMQALFQAIVDNLPQILQAGLEILMALGKAIMDALPQLLQAGVQIIKAIVDAIAQALPQLLEAGLKILKGLVQAIVENLPQLIEAGLQILRTIVQAIIDALPQLIEAAIQITLALFQALVDNAPKIIEAGVRLLIGLIEGLTNNMDKLIDGTIKIIEALFNALIDHGPQLIEAGFKLILALIQGLIQAIPELLGAIGNLIWKLLEKIGSFLGDMAYKGYEMMAKFIYGLVKDPGKPVRFMSQLGSNIVKTIGRFASSMLTAGVQLVQGLVRGIASMVQSVVNAAANMAKSAVNAVKRFLHIKSPSRLMAEQGRYFGQGFQIGIEDMISDVAGTAQSMAQQAADMVAGVQLRLTDNGLVDQVKDIFEQVQDAIPDTLPAPELEQLQKASLTPTSQLYTNNAPGATLDSGRKGTENQTNISIGTIIVRNNDDIDKLSRGLYNKSKETLSGMGDIVST